MSYAHPWTEPPFPEKPLPREELEDKIEELIAGHNICVMATIGKNGPIASPIEYYNYGLELYMLPDPGTPKLKAIERDPSISVAIHGSYHGWHSGKGAQFFGKGYIINPGDEEWEHGMKVFRWYEWMRDLGMDASTPFEKQVLKVVPDKILYTDTWLWKNGYGAKQKWLREG